MALIVYILIFICLFSWYLGLFAKFKDRHKKLAIYLFGVELPSILLTFIRMVFIRELTPILWFFILSALFSMLGLTISLFKDQFKTFWKQVILFLSFASALILFGYGAILSLFFLPIILTLLVKMIISLDLFEIIALIINTKGALFFIGLYFMVLFFGFIGLILVTPITNAIIYLKSFRAAYRNLKKRLPEKFAKIFLYSFIALYSLFVILLAWQKNPAYIEQSRNQYLNAQSFEENQKVASQIIKNEKEIKSNLIDAYLAPYRYIGDSQIDILLRSYQKELNLEKKSAENIQNFFNTLAFPFIYHGNFKNDQKNAKNWYESLFDAPIQEGEKDKIISALQKTNTRDELKAGLLDKGKRAVLLKSRTVEAESKENYLLAKVTIEEEFENTSNDLQEVYYTFSLPEDALITSLALGPQLEFKGILAPKGAARRTYEKQIRRNVDPALLEQIGPRQYKLRVFPIPAKNRPLFFLQRNLDQINPTESIQRLKWEYLTLISENGISLPHYSEERNLYQDQKTVHKYMLNDQIIDTPPKSSHIANTQKAFYCQKQLFKTTIAQEAVYFFPYSSLCELKISKNQLPEAINNTKMAVLLDASYSNGFKDWNNYFTNKLPLQKLIAQNQIDLYYFNSSLSHKININSQTFPLKLSILHLGKTDRLQALASLKGKYDLVLMITDESSFDTEMERLSLNNPSQPIYIIHLSENLPEYHDQLTKYILKSGGGVFQEPLDALQSYWQKRKIRLSSAIMNLNYMYADNHGLWLKDGNFPPEIAFLPPIEVIDSSEFKKLATHALLKNLIIKENIQNINVLNRIHTLAKQYSIVTPYSSLIALVNEAQKQDLKEAEKDSNRFKTNLDYGEEQLSDPSGQGLLQIGAVPEPEEWLLIISGLLILCYFYRHKLYRFFPVKK